MAKRKKIGLALGSGGVRGLAHVGVIKTLLKHNIPIDYIAGTSIGAWVAAYYGLFEDVGKLEELSVYQRKAKFYSFLEPTLKGGIIKGKKIEELLSGWFKNKSFNQTKIPVSVIATDLITAEPVILTEGKLAPAVRASMAIPTLFKPVEYKKHILVDGGMCIPVPEKIVRKMGADIVISVNLDNYQNDGVVDIKDLNFKNTASRSLDIMRYYLAKYSINDSDVVITPSFPDIGFSSWKKYFTENYGPKLVEIGEIETVKALKKIKKIM